MVAYEGFDVGPGDTAVDPAEAQAVGFGPKSVWSISGGEATITHDPIGLTYSDGSGARLATVPGGMRVDPTAGNPVVRRPYADNGLLVDQPYWVAFLVRSDQPGIGDAYWTPDGSVNVGAAGLQQYPNHRFVNDMATTVAAEQGVTALIVVHVRPDEASLWVNPALTDLGTPAAVLTRPPNGPTLDLMFGFNDLADGTYTVDEVRVGTTARSVTPIE